MKRLGFLGLLLLVLSCLNDKNLPVASSSGTGLDTTTNGGTSGTTALQELI